MKLTKKQIIDGLYQFVTDEVVPTMNGDKLTQFVLITAINFVKANVKLIDAIFANPMLNTLKDGDSEYYVVDALFTAMEKAMGELGSLPIKIPVPGLFDAGGEKTLTFKANDISALRRYMEQQIGGVVE